MGSKRCDCKEQLDLALDYVNEHGGALIYMPQEQLDLAFDYGNEHCGALIYMPQHGGVLIYI
ncbi:hypothetical protein T484DRAFT_1873144 [Baffinella frigidus]|nr:hypothetical protein T484DRAFT_1873144 [Cryptophyta sp. CCMP2293]